jgi:hypothetical protein
MRVYSIYMIDCFICLFYTNYIISILFLFLFCLNICTYTYICMYNKRKFKYWHYTKNILLFISVCLMTFVKYTHFVKKRENRIPIFNDYTVINTRITITRLSWKRGGNGMSGSRWGGLRINGKKTIFYHRKLAFPASWEKLAIVRRIGKFKIWMLRFSLLRERWKEPDFIKFSDF